MSILTFIDCETTHLDPRHGDAWEIAVIRRDPDGDENEYLWQVRPDLATADPESLKVGRFEERFAVPDGADAAAMSPEGKLPPFRLELPEFLFDLQEVLKNAVIVGSNPPFDDAFLKKLMWAHDRKIVWHYRTVDIATLAAGQLYGRASEMTRLTGDVSYYGRVDALLADGWKSYELSRAVGVEPPAKGVAHTALGDARWARDVYDAVTQPDAFYTASDEQLAALIEPALRNGPGGEA